MKKVEKNVILNNTQICDTCCSVIDTDLLIVWMYTLKPRNGTRVTVSTFPPLLTPWNWQPEKQLRTTCTFLPIGSCISSFHFFNTFCHPPKQHKYWHRAILTLYKQFTPIFLLKIELELTITFIFFLYTTPVYPFYLVINTYKYRKIN